VSTAAAARG